MTSPNSSDSGNIENSQEGKKQESSFHSQALNEFANKIVYEGLSDKPSEGNTLTGEYQKFLNASDRYAGVSSDVAGYSDEQLRNLDKKIRVQVLKERVTKQKNEETLYKALSTENDLGKKSRKVKERIEKLSKDDIQKYLRSSYERTKFLKSSGIYTSKELEELSSERAQSKEISKIVEKLQKKKLSNTEIEAIEQLSQNKNNISSQDINTILGLFSLKDAQKIFSYFVPVVSLGTIEKTQLISEKAIRDYYKKHISSELSKLGLGGDYSVEEMANSIDLSEIYISTSDLDRTHYQIISKSEPVLREMLDDINELKQEIRENVYGDIFDDIEPKGMNEDIHDEFVRVIGSETSKGLVADNVRNNIGKFKEGNYIKLDTKSQTPGYYKIHKTDGGNVYDQKTVTLKRLSTFGGVVNEKDAIEEIFTYRTIYDLFRADAKQAETTIEILDSVDFDDLELAEIPVGSIENINGLKAKLDIIDPEGKDIDISKTPWSVLDESTKPHYQEFIVTNINSKTITLKSAGNSETLSLDDFYTAFESKKGEVRRTQSITSYEEFVAFTAGNGIDSFSNISLDTDKNRLVLTSDKSDKDAKAIEYFVGDGGKAIKIHSIDNTSISYSLGTIEEKGKDGNTSRVFKGEYSGNRFGDFYLDLKKYNLLPDKEALYADMQEKKEAMKLKSSPIGKYLQWMSIKDMIAGGTMIVDGVKNAFEQGNKLKAAEFAESLGKVLPVTKNVKLELQSYREKIEKDTIQEMIDSMKVMGSTEIIKKVKGILESSGSAEYQIIAALFVIAEKYGTLYPKGLAKLEPDEPYNGIWFRRLGGHKYMDLVEELRKEADNPDKSISGKNETINFTEEELVFKLLTKRVKNETVRSKLNKDYRGAFNKGIEDELKDGEEKVAEKSTVEGKIGHVVGELENKGYPNAIGGMEKLFGKNSSAQAMNATPFILVFSGTGPQLPSPLVNKITTLAYTTPYTSLAFGTNETDTKVYQEAIIRYYKKTNKAKAGELEDILKKRYENRPGPLAAFWAENGKELVEVLTMRNPFFFLHQDEDPFFKKYYDTVVGVHGDPGYDIKDDMITEDVYNRNPIVFGGGDDELGGSTGGGLEHVRGDQGYGFGGEKSQGIIEMYFTYLEQLKTNSDLSDAEKEKVFKKVYPPVENAIRTKAMRGEAKKLVENNPNAPIVKAVYSKGLSVYTYSDTEDFNTAEGKANYERFLDEAWNKFYNSRISTGINTSVGRGSVDTSTTVQDILNKANEAADRGYVDGEKPGKQAEATRQSVNETLENI